MSNMSYCRFTNTLEDLEECLDALVVETKDDIADMDDDELENRNRLIEKCGEIADNYEAKERINPDLED